MIKIIYLSFFCHNKVVCKGGSIQPKGFMVESSNGSESFYKTN